jgi:hypothetical protein
MTVLYLCSSSSTKDNVKCSKCKRQCKTIHFERSRAKLRETLQEIGIDSCFLNRTPTDQEKRERFDKRDFVKLKSF